MTLNESVSLLPTIESRQNHLNSYTFNQNNIFDYEKNNFSLFIDNDPREFYSSCHGFYKPIGIFKSVQINHWPFISNVWRFFETAFNTQYKNSKRTNLKKLN